MDLFKEKTLRVRLPLGVDTIILRIHFHFQLHLSHPPTYLFNHFSYTTLSSFPSNIYHSYPNSHLIPITLPPPFPTTLTLVPTPLALFSNLPPSPSLDPATPMHATLFFTYTSQSSSYLTLITPTSHPTPSVCLPLISLPLTVKSPPLPLYNFFYSYT